MVDVTYLNPDAESLSNRSKYCSASQKFNLTDETESNTASHEYRRVSTATGDASAGLVKI